MDTDPYDPEQEQRRWLLLLHVLLAVTLVIPTGFVLAQGSPDAAGTLALVAALVGVYAVLFARPMGGHGDRRLALLYAVLVTGLYTALVLREEAYILVLYALLPQFFSALPRWLAMAAVVVLALLPGTIAGGLDAGDLFNAVAAVGLGLVVTIIIESLERRTERQREVIAALEAARVENERLAEEAAVQGRAAGVLAERQRLAHDIHDTLAQGFTSIVTQLEAAEQALAAADDVAGRRRAADHVDRAKRTAREGLAEARRTVDALRPAPLEEADLPLALDRLVQRWRETHGPGVSADVVVDGPPTTVPAGVEEGLLRVAQEALTNVARHAAADRVTVTVTYLDDVLLLDVQDDGVGIDPRATSGVSARSGFGLTSMRERVALLGGELTIEAEPGEGTTIAARVPLPPPDGTGASPGSHAEPAEVPRGRAVEVGDV